MPQNKEDEQDEQYQRLKEGAEKLCEYHDSVRIFATRITDKGTEYMSAGSGNWFAQFGQVALWVEKEKAEALAKAIKESSDDNDN